VQFCTFHEQYFTVFLTVTAFAFDLPVVFVEALALAFVRYGHAGFYAVPYKAVPVLNSASMAGLGFMMLGHILGQDTVVRELANVAVPLPLYWESDSLGSVL